MPDTHAAALQVIRQLQEAGHVAYLAGGCVRDQLLGRSPKDHDVATDAPPPAVRRLFRRTKLVGAQFGVVLVRMQGVEVEVATFRTDDVYLDGRRPSAVRFTTAEEDARRRDFTINGMFFDPLTDTLVDHVGGQQDLADRLIRCIGEPRDRFAEDHLRMLRAVRFAARLGFSIEAATQAAIVELAPRIAEISAERIAMELELILTDASRRVGWELLGATGLANTLIAGVQWSAAEQDRVGRILDDLGEPVSFALGLASLLAVNASGTVSVACRHLRCSNKVRQDARTLVNDADRLAQGQLTELADVKLLLATGLGDAACRLARAVVTTGGGDPAPIDEVQRVADGIEPAAVAPPPLLTGEDLLAERLPPGPIFSRILASTYRAQLNEDVVTREQALAMLQRLIAETRP